MQHVIARSARSAPGGVRLEGGDWITNNASLAVSKYYGFGLMDAGKMVYLAKHWNRVPQQLRCEIKGQDENRFEFSALFCLELSSVYLVNVVSVLCMCIVVDFL